MMYEQIRRNRRASWLLMGFVIALLAALGFAIGAAVLGGTSGGVGLLGVFGIVAIAWSILGYYSGDKMVLAVSGAHQVTHENEPQLFNVVEEMTIAGALLLVVGIVLAILAPLAAYSVQFAISRRREYLADASGVELTRDPLGLARALSDIAGDPQPLRHANRATAHLYIANPLKNKKTKEVSGVFDTHPPIQKRIGILLEMAHVGPEALAPGRRAAAVPPPHDPPPPPPVPPAPPA